MNSSCGSLLGELDVLVLLSMNIGGILVCTLLPPIMLAVVGKASESLLGTGSILVMVELPVDDVEDPEGDSGPAAEEAAAVASIGLLRGDTHLELNGDDAEEVGEGLLRPPLALAALLFIWFVMVDDMV